MESSVWVRYVNHLVKEVDGGHWHLILTPILKLDEGKSAVFGMLDFKHDDGLAAVVSELRGGGGSGGGVAHAHSIVLKGFLCNIFLHVFAIIFIFI